MNLDNLVFLIMSCALVALAGYWYFPIGLLAAAAVAWYWWQRMDRFAEQVRLYTQRVASGDWRAGFGRREGGAFGSMQASLESLHLELARELEAQAHA